MRRNAHVLPVLICACISVLSSAGCVRGSDVEIRNPLVAGGVDPSTIVKTHKPTEDQFGLPRHALSDEARLVSVDEKAICVAVTLRETDPISLREMEAELSAPSAASAAPIDVQEEPAGVTVHQGRVPIQQRTGETSSCTKRDNVGNCLSWDTQPTYATSYVSGAIEVHEAKGQVCFPNHGIVTKQTKQVTLEIELRRRAPRDGQHNPWAVFGGGARSKGVTFRWGFGAARGSAALPSSPPNETASTTVTTTVVPTAAVTAEPAPVVEQPPSKTDLPKENPRDTPPKAVIPPKRAARDPNTIIHEPRGAWDQRDVR